MIVFIPYQQHNLSPTGKIRKCKIQFQPFCLIFSSRNRACHFLIYRTNKQTNTRRAHCFHDFIYIYIYIYICMYIYTWIIKKWNQVIKLSATQSFMCTYITILSLYIHNELMLYVQWNSIFFRQSVQGVLILSFTESFIKKQFFYN